MFVWNLCSICMQVGLFVLNHCPFSHIYRRWWCYGYRRRKWAHWPEFESWRRLLAFQIALITNYSPSNSRRIARQASSLTLVRQLVFGKDHSEFTHVKLKNGLHDQFMESTHTCVCAYIYIYIYVCVCVCVCIYIYIYIYILLIKQHWFYLSLSRNWQPPTTRVKYVFFTYWRLAHWPCG